MRAGSKQKNAGMKDPTVTAERRRAGQSLRRMREAQSALRLAIGYDYIKDLSAEQRTPEACLAAVSKFGDSIEHLTAEQRSPAVCLAAVQQNGRAIRYLSAKQRTPAVWLAAVQQDGWAVQHLTAEQATPELCLAALRRDRSSIKFIPALILDSPGSETLARWLIEQWSTISPVLAERAQRWATKLGELVDIADPAPHPPERQRP